MFHPAKRAVALCCMLIAVLSFNSRTSSAQPPQTAASPGATGSGVVRGTVLDPDGHPVEGARVYGFTDRSSPPSARGPHTVDTDSKGNFVLPVYSGHVLLFAYKESDFYHDNVTRFDVPAGTNYFQTVDIRSGETIRGFVVHLPRQSAMLRIDVSDVDTNAPVNPVEYELCREDHPGDQFYCMTGGASEAVFDMVVPPDPISIKITAPSYTEWRYQDAKTGSSYLTLKETENRRLTVYLHPTIFNVGSSVNTVQSQQESNSPLPYPQPDLYSRYLAQHRDLYERLVQPSETNTAAAEIARWAKDDPGTRDFFASKLPPLIVDQFPRKNDPRTGMPVWNPVWLNAVRLAGQLKAVAAIPGLKRGLSKPPMFGAYDDCHGAGTMTSNAKLCNDVVARALADIGDPSVPVVARFLAKGDSSAKKRAMWILLNIDSPAAYKAIRDHLVSERDPAIKSWIQSTLDGSIHYHLVQ